MENDIKISTLAKEFAKQNLMDNPKPKLLYIDGYNTLYKFYDMDSKEPLNHWDLKTPFLCIKKLVDASQKSGYSLKVFIKNDNLSEVQKSEWMTNREKEVKFGKKKPPPKTGYLLWGFFKKCGVECLFSIEADFCDTISAYAQQDNAAILSKKRDLGNFIDRKYEVYEDYLINEEGFLILIPHQKLSMEMNRKLLDCPPKILYKNTAALDLTNSNIKDVYCGCPSALVKKFNNPYFIIRPLRQAVYFRLGVKEKIEYIILWNDVESEAVWDVTLVKADAKYDYLLEKPMEAVEEFFKVSSMKKPFHLHEILWKNHLYSLYTVVFETCSIISKESESTFFELLEKITEFKEINEEPRLLYLDAFNFLDKFIKVENNTPNHWDLKIPHQNVKNFVESTKQSNYLLKVFIKFENVSEDEKDIWMTRREEEVAGKMKKPPPKCAYLLWNFFNECGIEVFFTYEADFSDTIVSHAQENNALILSGSRKLMNYINKKYEIFEEFLINNKGFLELIPISKTIFEISDLKEILVPPAKIINKNVFSFVLKNKKELLLGCPSSLVKRYGNPYLTIRPLRQAVYYRLGITEMIEYISFWDQKDQKAIWDVTCVKADPKMNDLLDKPLEALEILFNVSKLARPGDDIPTIVWKNHLFCLYAVVLELCATVVDETEKKFLEFLRKVEEPILNDRSIKRFCNECSKEFEIDEGQQAFFEEKKLVLPKRCKQCIKVGKSRQRKIYNY